MKGESLSILFPGGDNSGFKLLPEASWHDLGLDAVLIYRQDKQTGLLTLDDKVDVPAGHGPRHLVFYENMMYVANELIGSVSVFRQAGNAWDYVRTVPTTAEGEGPEDAVAAIRLDGQRLFVSNRRSDSIAEFSIGHGNDIRLERTFSTFGAFPRDFVILPGRRILVANQNSGDVRLLGLEPLEPVDIEEKRPGSSLSFDSLFDQKKTREWMREIFGGQPEVTMPGGVYQIGDELPIAGAVCVCPDSSDA